MDLDGDGISDLLSGSYSRHDRDMAGLFQVLYGQKDGGFRKATILNGSDGAPLILPRGSGDDDVIDRICTRAFVVDLDGDGHRDLVAGNFRGTFAFFRGEAGGKFAPASTWLQAEGKTLGVDSHGDPFFVDWDGDGDFDLLSGSARGGVFLFPNEGSRTQPKFGAKVTLVASSGRAAPGDVRFGDAHLTGPASDTRVWADDVDGDGKLDLLVGDQLTLLHVAPGVTEADARTKYAAWQQKQKDLFKAQVAPVGEDGKGEKEAVTVTAGADFNERYQALEKERDAFARQETTGFVWLLRGK